MTSKKDLISKVKWIPLPRTEKTQVLSNPYCGFYSIYRFYANSEYLHPYDTLIEQVPIDDNCRICLVEINLLPFNDKELTVFALSIVKRIFQFFALRHKQMIVRFVYDWEGKGLLSEPNDISIIQGHMNQLSPLLKEYTDDIYVLQGLFIGSWGEMHNTRYLEERHMTRLARHLYQCAGEKTQIALRCPSYWRMVFKTILPLDEETAAANVQKSRFSLFNDGIMASDTDYGTYGNMNAKDSKLYSDKWTRRDELDFQKILCRYVSNGGEVINENPLNNAAPAIETLRQMKVSYLHSQYDEHVLSKWRSEKSGVASPLWKDMSAYSYIEAHLGYRFRIEDVSLSLSGDRNHPLNAVVTIRNTGFAPCYHQFEVRLIIRTTSYSKRYEYPSDSNTRLWMPDEQVEIKMIIPTMDIEPGQYILCFGIYDPRTHQSIRLANTFSDMDYTGSYSLGNFMIG